MAKSDPALKSYLNQIARYPLLTVNQEIQYGRRIAKMRELKQLDRELTEQEKREVKSGQKAKERFMQCNLQLVVHIAKKYERRTRRTLEIMDLIQEGNIGLSKAVEMFDYSRGYRFSTYAYWWIKQGIHRAIACTDSMIRLPAGVQELAAKIAKTTSDLGHSLGRTPTVKEIAQHLDISVDAVYSAIQRNVAVSSLDITPSASEKIMLLDMIADPQSLTNIDELSISHQAEEMIKFIEKDLDSKARFIVKNRRLQQPMPWKELESVMGLSTSRMQQIERQALLKLRMLLNKGKELNDTPLGKYFA